MGQPGANDGVVPPTAEEIQAKAAAIQAVRDAVMQEVDDKVQAKIEELWQKGKTMLSQLTQKHKEKTAALAEELTKCHEKQKSLEQENEQLKQVVNSLNARFSLMDVAITKGMQFPTEMTGTTTTPPSEAEFWTPGMTPGSMPPDYGGLLPEAKLPEVPAFPFPSPQPPKQLHLLEALQQTPQRKPLSLASSLGASPEPYNPLSSSGNGLMFHFTLRKADGADLGLNVSHQQVEGEGLSEVLEERVLSVEGIREHGAVEAWNRQCAGTAIAEKAVQKGDRIVSVNGVTYDPIKMLEECRNSMLLKLVIVRGDYPLPPLPAQAPAGKSTTLRADASVFVPSGEGSEPVQDRERNSC